MKTLDEAMEVIYPRALWGVMGTPESAEMVERWDSFRHDICGNEAVKRLARAMAYAAIIDSVNDKECSQSLIAGCLACISLGVAIGVEMEKSSDLSDSTTEHHSARTGTPQVRRPWLSRLLQCFRPSPSSKRRPGSA